jgi:CubicO group peptidase (beta-lactamase class C family)
MKRRLLVALAVCLGSSPGANAQSEFVVVPPSEAARRGIDVSRIGSSVRGVLDRALADSAFPGAIAIIGSRSGVLAEYAVGHLEWGEASAPDRRTLWDLASLTKIVSLTSAVAHLVGLGKLDIEAPVQRYLPTWRGQWKDQVRVSHLLTHSAGLPAWRPLYKEAESAPEARALVLSTPLETPPGLRMLYSDLGAILLGEIVARVGGMPLDEYVERHIFAPLGMRETLYRPSPSLRDRVAPTEFDPWRQRKVRGEVHDENAFRLGGVSAHAGLFSTGADLVRFARMYLNYGMLDGVRVLDSATVVTITARYDSTLSHRALGWETANGANSGGNRLSRRAFGHTGFTGTSMWIDPVHDLFVILLSNRVNPTRENRRIGGVRIALADAVVNATIPAPTGTRQ